MTGRCSPRCRDGHDARDRDARGCGRDGCGLDGCGRDARARGRDARARGRDAHGRDARDQLCSQRDRFQTSPHSSKEEEEPSPLTE